MPSTFTALNLPAGEAFLLETEHAGSACTILVDSGMRGAGMNSQHPLVSAIEDAAPGLRCIDIAVCTHQDCDHAGGFQDFADAWYSGGGKIGEYWLPGRWAPAVPGVLQDPAELVSQLWSGSRELAGQLPKRNSSDAAPLSLDDRLRIAARELSAELGFEPIKTMDEFPGRNDERRPEEQESDGHHDERVATSLGVTRDGLDGISGVLEEGSSRPSEQIQRLTRQGPWSPLWWWDTPEMLDAESIFWDALDVAKTIAVIAESAVKWRIPVRWFDFGEFERNGRPSGGNATLLEPVCAVEVRLTKLPPTPRFAMVLALSLRLSKQNVESLVFYRPATEMEPPVLFLGDSRLAFGVSKPEKSFLMPDPAPDGLVVATAPHHGSGVNDHAYNVVDQWLACSDGDRVIYVRNGGQNNQKLAAFLRQANRACVRCRGFSAAGAAAVRLSSQDGTWVWPANRVCPCRCGP